MATIEDVAAIAASLPEVEEGERHGTRTWSVAKKAFAWERGFSKADLKRFGDEPPPDGPIVAVRVAAVLIQLKKVGTRALREAIVDGWLACAPDRLTDAYVKKA